MAQVSDIMLAVEKLRTEHMTADMIRKPEGDPAYAHGHAQGKYLAFSMVLARIEAILEEEAERDSEREKD